MVLDTKISVSYGYTKNLGNYESERLDVKIERFLEGDEIPEDAWAAEFTHCKDFVRGCLNLDYEIEEDTEKQVEEMLNRRNRRKRNR